MICCCVDLFVLSLFCHYKITAYVRDNKLILFFLILSWLSVGSGVHVMSWLHGISFISAFVDVRLK